MLEKDVLKKLETVGTVEVAVERETVKMITVTFPKQQHNITQGVEVLRFVTSNIPNVIMGSINPESVTFSIKKIPVPVTKLVA